MAFELNQTDLKALLLGGCFFGSGGGGTVISANHLVEQFVKGSYYPRDTAEVVSVDEATEGETVMVAYMGAPEAINSTLYPDGPVKATEQIINTLRQQGKKLAYVVSPESGALGFVVAALVAAKLGLKVIDADGAGRAVPSLPMLTYAAAEISPRPTFLVSQSGLVVELNVTPGAPDPTQNPYDQDVSVIVEQMTRPIVADAAFGEFGGLAMWVMSPDQLHKALPITGTLKRALEVGRKLKQGEITDPDQMIALLRKEYDIHAHVIASKAKFDSATVSTTGGFDLGKIYIKTDDATLSVLYQNESLLAWSDQKTHPVVIAPDSIAYFVEGDTQHVYSNGDLVNEDGSLNPGIKQYKVTLLAWEADKALREKDGLILYSFTQALQTLGYLGNYVPVGQLNRS